MAKRGRPTTYFDLVQPRMEDVKDWAGEGLTRPEIAKRLGIDRATLHRYMNDHDDLRDAIKSGDGEIVANVEAALAKKALAGDVTAMIFFLKNKAPGKWRDKQEIKHSGGMGVAVQANPTDVEAAMRKLVKKGNADD